MRIELSCKCGATGTWVDDHFINGGGKPDDKGRIYIIEARAEEWMRLHQGHAI